MRALCNDFGNNIPYSAYLEAFSETQIPVRFPTAAPNLEPRDDIWPTDTAPVIRQMEDGFEFARLRWGFPPGRPKGNSGPRSTDAIALESCTFLPRFLPLFLKFL